MGIDVPPKMTREQVNLKKVSSNYRTEAELWGQLQSGENEFSLSRIFSDADDPLKVLLWKGIEFSALSRNVGEPLAQAFLFCDLDPNKISHWRALASAMAEVIFKKSGAPQKWDESALVMLAIDIRIVQRDQPKLKSHQNIARALIKSKATNRYRDYKIDDLRKRVSKALEPTIQLMIDDPDRFERELLAPRLMTQSKTKHSIDVVLGLLSETHRLFENSKALPAKTNSALPTKGKS